MFMQLMSFVIAPALALILLGGCQSASTPSAGATATPPQRAIVVSGNAGSTTVYLPSNDPDKPLMLSTSGSGEACPECTAAAIKYFQTGVLDPKCSRTGATRTVTNLITPNYGHN